jgi:hypothetical protein
MMHTLVAAYGAILIVIGLVGYFGAGMLHWTALIPAILGVVALLFAAGPLRRKLPVGAVAAGVVVAALALFGTAGAIAELPAALAGDPAVNAGAVLSRGATAIVSIGLLLALAAGWLKGRNRARA